MSCNCKHSHKKPVGLEDGEYRYDPHRHHNVAQVNIIKREYGVMRTLEIRMKKRTSSGELKEEVLTLFLIEQEEVSFEDRSHTINSQTPSTHKLQRMNGERNKL